MAFFSFVSVHHLCFFNCLSRTPLFCSVFLFFCLSSLFLQLFISNPSFLFCIFVLLFIILFLQLFISEPLFSVLCFLLCFIIFISSPFYLEPLFSVLALVVYHLSLFNLSRNLYFDTMDWLGKG